MSGSATATGSVTAAADIGHLSVGGIKSSNGTQGLYAMTVHGVQSWRVTVSGSALVFADQGFQGVPVIDPDGDSVPSNIDSMPLDTDNDGFDNNVDNCPAVYNPDQLDANSNGMGDACEGNAQTITVTTAPPAQAAYNSTFAVAATASSGLPVVVSTIGGCTSVGNIVTMTSSTTACIVTFRQDGSLASGFAGAPTVTYYTTATRASQTITVTTLAPASAALNSTFPVAATASSGLPVAITVNGGCTIAGGTVTMTSATTACTVKFNQAGNVAYFAATQVTSNTAATKMTQVITVTTPAPVSAALNSTFPVAATVSSGLPVAITVSGGCTITSGVVTMTSATTACTVNFDQAGDANYSAAPQVTSNTNATKATQVITVTIPFAPAFAAVNDTFPVAAIASSGLLVSITTTGSCSGAGTGSATITMLGTSCTVNFNQSGDATYFAAPLVVNTTTAPVTVLPLDSTHSGAKMSGGVRNQ